METWNALYEQSPYNGNITRNVKLYKNLRNSSSSIIYIFFKEELYCKSNKSEELGKYKYRKLNYYSSEGKSLCER